MNFDEVKTVLFPVLEGMGYTLDLDEGFDLQPAVVTFDRQNKTMCIDPKADSFHQVIGALSMYFERFPWICKRAVYFQGGHRPDGHVFAFKDCAIGYVDLDNYDLKKFVRFICAITIAAQQKVR